MQEVFSFFNPLDDAVMQFMHNANLVMGGVLTPLTKIITFLGEGGIAYFLTAIILALFKKTRKVGVCIFGAVCLGALITNIILKDLICRPRPFIESEVYNEYWALVGCPKEDGFSFPSGHATSVMAFATALFLTVDKKYSWLGFVGVLLMAFSRVYLMAHFITDQIAGILIGGVSGIIAYLITLAIFKFLTAKRDNKFFGALLDFDVVESFKK
jgi:undecaprenyl-diphosphatase